MNDVLPTVVALPAGSYKVEAEAVDCDSRHVEVLMTVVIKPGKTTSVHLEGGFNPDNSLNKEIKLVKLPCGRAIGWRAAEAERAPEAGFAGGPPSSQAN